MLDLDYEMLAGDFLRALRGDRSQVAFSRRLKYKSNVCYAWESGRNWPTAATTLWAASRVGVDLPSAIAGFYRTPPAWLHDTSLASPEGVATLLDDLRGDTTILQIAAATDRSRYAVSRWLKGEAQPRLPDFFRLIEATSQRLLDFLSHLVNVEDLETARDAWRQLQAARALVGTMPWSPAILLMLQTEAYAALPAHRPGWIAERLGLPERAELECMELLKTSGQIRRERDRWKVVRVLSIDTRNDPAAGRRLKQWWAQVGVDAIAAERAGLFSYNVFNVSQADFERLQSMHRNYFRALRAVVGASEPAERVCVANVQLFALEGHAAS